MEVGITYPWHGLVFDRPDYLQSLPHLGSVLSLEGVPFGLLRRPVFETGSFDLMGGWPYCSAPRPEALCELHRALVASGGVSFLSILPPDFDASSYTDLSRFSVLPLKQHYVFDPALPPLPLSRKARSNLRLAERHWRVERGAPADEVAPLATELHEQMAARRQVSGILRLTSAHFNVVLRIAGIETLVIRGNDGVLGGVAIAARHSHQTQMFHILVDARARRTNGAYLLMQAACTVWGASHPLYMGGAPSSPGSSGVAQFKERWANRLAPVQMLTAILDPIRYHQLAATRGDPRFFPAYRHADGREHVRAAVEAAIA